MEVVPSKQATVYKNIQAHVPTAKIPNEVKCRRMMELIRATIKEAAAKANIGYVDVSGAFRGHEMFSRNPCIWRLFDQSAWLNQIKKPMLK
ncbi:unnamed protein product [Adineta ricciae]|nr:unnamed protein product [Adineta ricciae]